MSEDKDMSEVKPRVEDVLRSMTGFDELAVEKHFRNDLGSLNPTMTARAVAFVVVRREQPDDDKAAWAAVMKMPIGDINDMFDTSDLEDPEGKG
jgi:hypothetical protein